MFGFHAPLELAFARHGGLEAAGFAAWYELFPRSMSHDASRHGTFDDVISRLIARGTAQKHFVPGA